MEINKIANTPSVPIGKKAAASFSPSVSFAELTAKEQEKLRNERLRQLADEIEQQGKNWPSCGRLTICGGINSSSDNCSMKR